MAQYIDREAAVKLLRNQALEALEYSTTECEVLASVADELEDFPAADVEPIVRGHWHVIKTSCAGMIVTSYQCTVCGKTCATQMRIFHDDDVPMCCCWCGARMDEEAPNGGDTD